MMRGLFACLLAVLLVAAAAAQAKPKTKGHKGTGRISCYPGISIWLSPSMRKAARWKRSKARQRPLRHPIRLRPARPTSLVRSATRTSGNLHDYTETEVEAGMPMWLPGQREAYEGTA